MKRLLISYSRKNVDDVTVLSQELRYRGIKLWRDVSDLRKGFGNETQIRNAIRKECLGFLLYFTPDVLESDFVLRIEIPAAFDKLSSDKKFVFLPVFKGITIKDSRKEFFKKTGFNIAGFNGFEIKKSADLSKIPPVILRDIVKTYLSLKKREIVVNLHSKQYTNYVYSDLDIDFTLLCANNGLRHNLTKILNAIIDIKKVLTGNNPCRNIFVRGKFHLSIGLCFGYVFRSTTGFALKTEQRGKIWHSKHVPMKHKGKRLLHINSQEGYLRSRNLVVEISISQNISNDVNTYISSRRIKYRRRLIIKKSHAVVQNSREAGQITSLMTELIKKACRECRIRKVHLFIAAPLSLAILVGHQLNACGQIQCYEFDNIHNTYMPSFLLY